MSEHPYEPSPEQCSRGAKLAVGKDGVGYACWYPQMGGYVGKAIVVPDPGGDPDSCFDVYVWHDGEFPFDGDDDVRGGPPRALHHCSAEQFIEFGQFVQRAMSGEIR
jgi:hypothetical protein